MEASALEHVLRVAEERSIPRGGFFLRQGDIAHQVAIITEGVLREYYTLADGRERTRAFAQEHELAGSLTDLLLQRPALSSSVAATAVRLVVVPWAHLSTVREEHPSWRRFSLRVLEHLYLLKARREYELLALDAGQRYEAFQEAFPGLESRVKQTDIASYLGISPEHLSRLKRSRRVSGNPD